MSNLARGWYLPLAAVVLATSSCVASDPAVALDIAVDNVEIQAIVAADQQDREPELADIDWTIVAERDTARQERVRAMLDAGELQTGKDFDRAALVFQHGSTNSDILLAHVLAVTALAKGHTESRRMAALTLDRYLTQISEAQVFGTNFSIEDVDGSPDGWTLDPYDDRLIPDTLRAINCVASRDVTEQLLERMRAGDMTAPAPVCPEPNPAAP